MGKKRRKKRRIKGRVFLVLLMLAAVVATLASPVFNIESIEISTGENLTQEQILMASGITAGVNTFKFSMGRARKRIAGIPYVDTVRVRRKLPGAVSIDVTESVLLAYVPYMGSMAGIDKNAKVLEVVPIQDESEKIYIDTAQPKKIDPGEQIGIDEPKIIDIIVLYLSKFEEYGISETVERLHVPSQVETGFTTRTGLYVNFSETDDMDYKFNMYLRVLTEIGSDAAGFLDLSVPEEAKYRKNI